MSDSNKLGEGDPQLANHGQVHSRDTLEIWLSALLDGELTKEQEALLFTELQRDPSLVEQLGDLTRVRNLCADGLAPTEAVAFTDRIMAALQKIELPQSEREASDEIQVLQLASALLDDALGEEETRRFQELISQNAMWRAEVLTFLQTSQVAQAHLHQRLHTFESLEGFADCAQKLDAAIVEDEQKQLRLQSYFDAESTDADRQWLETYLGDSIQGRSRVEHMRAVLESTRMLSSFLRAPADWPLAGQAGQAALQAIAAEEILHEEHRGVVADHEPEAQRLGWMHKAWSQSRALAAPVVMVAGVAAFFIFVPDHSPSDPPAMQTPGGEREAPLSPHQWSQSVVQDFDQQLKKEQNQQRLALRKMGEMSVLSNNQAEIQTLEMGGQSTLVFGTGASNITVIWLPENRKDVIENRELFESQGDFEQGT